MRPTPLAACLLAATALLCARPASAQMGALSIGAAIGSVSPQGDVKGSFKTGTHLEALGELSLPLVPIGFRGEVAYDQMGNKTAGAGSFKVASGVVDATFSMPFPIIHPYAIGGVGYYIHNSAFGAREGKVGWNAGAGVELKLAVVSAFAEARYHAINYSGGNVRMVPLTIGLKL